MRLALVGGAWVLAGLTFYLDTRATDRLFPSRPLSLMTSVGITSWMFVMFGMTTGQVTVFMPLIVQTLYGVSPLGAGYFTAVLSFSWTTLALCSAGWQDRRARLAILLGPLVITSGVIGLSVSVGSGSLLRLGALLALIGAGIGVCYAHISSWAIAAGRAGEEGLTASSIPMLQSLGIAFGVATAGLVANMAGLASGVSSATVAAAATWVYALCIIAPLLLMGLALRLLRLYRETHLAPSTP
jgi:MFS family permease